MALNIKPVGTFTPSGGLDIRPAGSSLVDEIAKKTGLTPEKVQEIGPAKVAAYMDMEADLLQQTTNDTGSFRVPGTNISATPDKGGFMDFVQKSSIMYGRGLLDLHQGVKQMFLEVVDEDAANAYTAEVAKGIDAYQKLEREFGSHASAMRMAGMAGSVPGAGAIGGAISKAVPLIGRLGAGTSAKAMAAKGALTGAAYAGTEFVDEDETRLGNAAMGAAAGGLGAAALAGATKTAGGLANGIMESLGSGHRVLNEEAREVFDRVRQFSKFFKAAGRGAHTGSELTLSQRMPDSPMAKGLDHMAEALGLPMGSGLKIYQRQKEVLHDTAVSLVSDIKRYFGGDPIKAATAVGQGTLEAKANRALQIAQSLRSVDQKIANQYAKAKALGKSGGVADPLAFRREAERIARGLERQGDSSESGLALAELVNGWKAVRPQGSLNGLTELHRRINEQLDLSHLGKTPTTANHRRALYSLKDKLEADMNRHVTETGNQQALVEWRKANRLMKQAQDQKREMMAKAPEGIDPALLSYKLFEAGKVGEVAEIGKAVWRANGQPSAPAREAFREKVMQSMLASYAKADDAAMAAAAKQGDKADDLLNKIRDSDSFNANTYLSRHYKPLRRLARETKDPVLMERVQGLKTFAQMTREGSQRLSKKSARARLGGSAPSVTLGALTLLGGQTVGAPVYAGAGLLTFAANMATRNRVVANILASAARARPGSQRAQDALDALYREYTHFQVAGVGEDNSHRPAILGEP